MTDFIVLLSEKAKTGKTSLSINVASLLAKKGYLVTLIDMDFHSPSLYNYFIDERIEKKVSIDEYLLGSEDPGLIVELTPILKKYSPEMKTGGDLFCIFADTEMGRMEGIENSEKEKSESITRLIRLINYDILDREFIVNKNREHLGSPDFVILDLDINSIFWLTNGLSLIDIVFMLGPSTVVTNQNKLHSWQVLEVFESHGKTIESFLPIPFHKDLYQNEYLTVLRHPNHEYSKYVESITSRILSDKLGFD